MATDNRVVLDEYERDGYTSQNTGYTSPHFIVQEVEVEHEGLDLDAVRVPRPLKVEVIDMDNGSEFMDHNVMVQEFQNGEMKEYFTVASYTGPRGKERAEMHANLIRASLTVIVP